MSRCYGYAQGVMGGLLTVPAFLQRFPQVDTINNGSARNALVQGTYLYPVLATLCYPWLPLAPPF